MKYSKEQLEEAVKNNVSYSGVLRYLGIRQSGGSQTYLKRRIKEFGINTEHFTGQAYLRGTVSSARKSSEDILVKLEYGEHRQKTHLLKRALLDLGRDYVCESKGCEVKGKWLGDKITLQIDHIDGDYTNNKAENLRFLCPNCHSQTKTYGSKNKTV